MYELKSFPYHDPKVPKNWHAWKVVREWNVLLAIEKAIWRRPDLRSSYSR
jgi:hypothetical protein